MGKRKPLDDALRAELHRLLQDRGALAVIRREAKRPKAKVRRNIDPYYWSLWAVRRANAMPEIGYPTQVPWYQPARLGNVEVEEGPPRMPAMVDDWRVVDRIDVAVNEHLRRRPSEVRALEIYERAYRNAADTFEKRCEDCGVVVATCRRMAIRAKAAIDQAVGEIS